MLPDISDFSLVDEADVKVIQFLFYFYAIAVYVKWFRMGMSVRSGQRWRQLETRLTGTQCG